MKHMMSVVILLHPDERGITSKTGELNESLAIRRPWLSDLVGRWAAARKASAMWDHTAADMRTTFLDAARGLGLEKWRPVLYMGRHSGASLDRLQEVLPLKEVQKRGRWSAESSVKRYEKRALVQEVYLSMPLAARKKAHRHEQELVRTLRRMCDALCGSRRGTRA